jgi:predicted RNase H-like HicB family nuclease
MRQTGRGRPDKTLRVAGGTPRAEGRSPLGSPSCLGDDDQAARVGGCPAGWYITGVTFKIELECEEDGRWIAEVPALPGVLCYGQDRDEAVAGVQALALRVIAERLENREAPAEFLNVTFQAA